MKASIERWGLISAGKKTATSKIALHHGQTGVVQ
jgi:hypothetical protein